jgi:diguanylate cyclase (GGDEF)-like protein
MLIAVFSFRDIYVSTGEMLQLTTSLSMKRSQTSSSQSPSLVNSANRIEQIRLRAYKFFSFALFFSSVGALLLIYIYRRNIMEPMYHVTHALQKMSEGEFKKLPVVEDTEIGILTEKFNEMGQALKDKIQEYEKAIVKEQKVIRELNILNELNSTLIFKLNVHEVLEAIILFSEPLVKSDIRAMIVVDELTHQITHFFTSFTKYKHEIVNLAHKIIQELLHSNVPIRFNKFSEDLRSKNFIEDQHIQINNVLAVPILIDEKIRGALFFLNKTGGGEFEIDEEDSALAVSIQASVAIKKALYHEETLHLAKTDGLTGLNNHRTFHEILDFEIKRAKRFNRDLSLLLIDVDKFKKFNDTYGHQAGDQVLKVLATIIRNNLRSIDSAARYGGEEFTIILPETVSDGAVITADRIKDDIHKQTLDFTDNKASLSVSIGVATFLKDAVDKENLIKAADNALYMAKRKGRNLVITSQQYKADIAKQQ